MNTFALTSDARAWLKSARTLMVIAPQKTFAGRLPPHAPKGLLDLAKDLAADVKPGDLGGWAATLTGSAAPRRLVVGVLPDAGSRYNSPARAESVRSVMQAAGPDKEGKTAVLLVLDDASHFLPAGNALARALPLFDAKSTSKPWQVMAMATGPDGRPLAAPAGGVVSTTVETTREAARLVDTPPSDLHPAAFAQQARRLLRGLRGVKIQELVGPALVKRGLLGIHSVGRCAGVPPRLVMASLMPTKGARGGRHVALVGKGVTYDTGGLNLKVGGTMSGMKGDMGGAAAVLGAFRVLARTGCRHRLSLVLCMAENAIGPAAYKPDDILRLHSGKTVEINNTDAEGRLLLADGVSFAARELGADVVLDAATLTGAQRIATGALHAAIFSNDAELEAHFVRAGRASGDLCHPLPWAPEFYQQEFKSPVADMRNSVKDRANAQSSCAAQFVWSHLDGTKVRWCHVDMAGPSSREDRATGYGVALLSEVVRGL